MGNRADLCRASEFSIDNNGTVRSLGKVDYDLGSSRSLKVRATNENNASVVGEFVISVVDAVDDLDGDGVADVSDSDADGDGLSNAEETDMGYDPFDSSSRNRAPYDLSLLSVVELSEDLAVGTGIAQLGARDPDPYSSLTYTLATGEGDSGNAKVTLTEGGNCSLPHPWITSRHPFCRFANGWRMSMVLMWKRILLNRGRRIRRLGRGRFAGCGG